MKWVHFDKLYGFPIRQLTVLIQFPELIEQGLITFDHLGHLDNAIPLCPTCHRNFDDLNKPGSIFLPSDLQYFIDYEIADFARRDLRAKDTGTIPRRTCPDPQAYYEHQIRTGVVEQEDGAWGGLYFRYTLYDYFPNLGQSSSWIPGRGPFQEPEAWHGAPMAAIWRAFLILGNPLCGIPDKETRLLRELQDLYKRRVTLNSSTSRTMGNSGSGEDSEEHQSSAGRDPRTHHFHSTAQNEFPQEGAGTSSGEQRYSALQDSEPSRNEHHTCNFVDSAVDFASELSQSQKQDHLSNAIPKYQFMNSSTRTIKKGCIATRKLKQPRGHIQSSIPSYSAGALPEHRPRSNLLKQQSWVWGPTLSSEDKIEQHGRKKRRLYEVV